MRKMRVYEVAKLLGMEKTVLLGTLKALGIEAANSFSVVDANEVYRKIADAVPHKKKPVPPPELMEEQPPAEPEAPAPVEEPKPAPQAAAPAPAPAPPSRQPERTDGRPPRRDGAPQDRKPAGGPPPPPPPPKGRDGKTAHEREKEKSRKQSPRAKHDLTPPPKLKKTDIVLELEEVKPATDETAPVDFTSPSKRYDAIKQKGLQQQAPRKGQKITFIKKKGGKKDKDSAAAEQAAPVITSKSALRLSGPMTVREVSNETGLKSSDIIMFLMKEFNLMATLNHSLDMDLVKFVCEHFEVGVEIKTGVGDDIPLSDEPDTGDMETRPPVVTIMGHVDHGKTKLLDAIRKTNVVDTESGGITQHIGAYQIEHQGRKITFLDTPGHESFTALRARGAKVTDLAVLVVAADDGVMPQTVEAIDHARDANVPILVAINKVDKPSSNVDRTKRQLSDKGLQPEEWGGTTVCVEVSAKMGQNINELIDMMFLVTDLLELKANEKRKAVGTVIEAQLDKGKGPTATVLVQNGTLSLGDHVVVGLTAGRIRAMETDRGEQLQKAGPSTPVRLFGLDHVPESGDQLFVLEDEKTVREIVNKRRLKDREEKLRYEGRVSLDDLFNRIKDGKLKEFKVIIKGDVQGSVEAITQSLEKIEHEEVRVKVIRADVGEVSETDVMFAAAAGAVIMTFHTGINPTAKAIAQRERVDVRHYEIIYRLIEEVKMAMAGMLAPEYDEHYTGRAEVRKIFESSRFGKIAGSYVEDGTIRSNSIVAVIRNGKELYKGKLSSLKRFKDNVKNVEQGFECGIVVDNFDQLQEGDKIEAFELVEKKRDII